MARLTWRVSLVLLSVSTCDHLAGIFIRDSTVCVTFPIFIFIFLNTFLCSLACVASCLAFVASLLAFVASSLAFAASYHQSSSVSLPTAISDCSWRQLPVASRSEKPRVFSLSRSGGTSSSIPVTWPFISRGPYHIFRPWNNIYMSV